jgi:hypothetical protein
MVYLVARSTRGVGRPKSGEGDPTALVRQGLVLAWKSFTTPRGSYLGARVRLGVYGNG